MKARSPSAERNRQPILELLQQELPTQGTVLEVASGSGQHALYFCLHLPKMTWQPSDCDKGALASIESWREDAALENFRTAINLDIFNDNWPVSSVDALIAINLLHIAPEGVMDALFRGAANSLTAQAPVILYGPFRKQGQELASSNLAFERYLKSLSDDYGIRSLQELRAAASKWGYFNSRVVEMPANNHGLVFRRDEGIGE